VAAITRGRRIPALLKEALAGDSLVHPPHCTKMSFYAELPYRRAAGFVAQN